MKILLLSQTLGNFRRWRSLELTPNGRNMTIFAENACGKTSIADGISFPLTGKDSLGRMPDKGFDIKPFDPDKPDEVLHGLEYSAEGVYAIDDDTVSLKCVFKEKYKTDRGVRDVFDGNTTDYYIDGHKKTEGQFLPERSRLFPPKYAQLLTDVTYLHRQKRDVQRGLLIDIFGGIEDADVIASDPELHDLSKMIGPKTSVADLHADAKLTRKTVDDGLKAHPFKVTAKTELLREIDESKDWAKIAADWVVSLAALQERRNRIAAGGASAELGVVVTKLEGELDIEARRINQVWYDAKQKATAANDARDRTIRQLQSTVSDDKALLGRKRQAVIDIAAKMEEGRKAWAVLNDSKFDGATEIDPKKNACITCGRELPEEEVAENIRKFIADRAAALQKFNLERAEALKKNMESGKTLAGNLKEAEQAVKDVEAQITAAEKSLAEIQSSDPIPVPPAPVLSEDEKYAEVFTRLQEARRSLAASTIDNSPAFAEIDALISDGNEKLKAAQKVVSDKESNDLIHKQLDELKAELAKLGTQSSKCLEQIFLCERFLQRKAELLTDKINGNFKLTDFRMFEKLGNGEIKEDCVATLDGKAYDSALSESERIRVGLDVIDGISKKLGIFLPIVVDGAESILDLPETESQQIRLVVARTTDPEWQAAWDKKAKTDPNRVKISAGNGQFIYVAYEGAPIATEPQGTLIS